MSTWLIDVHAVLARNLVKLRRSPEILAFSVLQPIVLVVLFTQVYGGAIHINGSTYTHYLMAGIFAMTTVFGSMVSGIYMATDLSDGIVHRFRTLPMAPSAVLMARTLSDMVVAAASLVVMLVTGFVVGWRYQAGFGNFVAGLLLLLGTAWCLSWIMTWLGLVVRSPQAVSNAGNVVLFPVAFVSNAFVPTETLPEWLRWFAEWNPISALVQGVRELFGNTGSIIVPEVWPLQHPVLATVLGWLVMLLVFPLLATRVFHRTM